MKNLRISRLIGIALAGAGAILPTPIRSIGFANRSPGDTR